MNLLIIEDDVIIGRALSQGFREAGHECEWVRDGERGFAAANSQQFDVVVLDIMLPIRSGLEVLADIRTNGIRTPVILLTAMGTVDDRVTGLQTGADDYLVKPFAFAELMARIVALFRRAGPRPSLALQSGDLSLDLTNRRVQRGDVEIDLTPTEFSLLEYLLRHAGQVVTRRMLCEHLWNADWEGETNVIEVHINRLRGKLERSGSPAPIQTVRGRGYVLRPA